MAGMIDPAADFLWESVSTTVETGKTVEKQPRTDAEWAEVRRQAIILAEGANLIMMDGRHVVKEGSHARRSRHAGQPDGRGIGAGDRREPRLPSSPSRRRCATSASRCSTAADAKNPQGLIDAGDTMDQVCEGCHLQFWYPGQKIPLFPDQAPEASAPRPIACTSGDLPAHQQHCERR